MDAADDLGHEVRLTLLLFLEHARRGFQLRLGSRVLSRGQQRSAQGKLGVGSAQVLRGRRRRACSTVGISRLRPSAARPCAISARPRPLWALAYQMRSAALAGSSLADASRSSRSASAAEP